MLHAPVYATLDQSSLSGRDPVHPTLPKTIRKSVCQAVPGPECRRARTSLRPPRWCLPGRHARKRRTISLRICAAPPGKPIPVKCAVGIASTHRYRSPTRLREVIPVVPRIAKLSSLPAPLGKPSSGFPSCSAAPVSAVGSMARRGRSRAYFSCAHFTTPAWNSLIADWLDQHERGAYFARRAQIIASLSFLALCGAGWVLSLWQHSTAAWWGFVLIFTLAGSARILSAITLSPVQDVHPTAHQEAQQGFRGFFRLSATKDFRRFLLFSGLMHAAVLIAGPFFVLYMLQDLHLSYFGYGGWLAAGLLGQLLTLQAWGQFGDRFGNKALLSITGFTVPFLPMLYLVSTNLGFLLAVNFLGGVIWAGLALGLQNYVFDSVRPEDRAKAIALYSTVNAIGWSVGALLGSWLVERLPHVSSGRGVIFSLYRICLMFSSSRASCGCWSPPAFLAPSMKRAKWSERSRQQLIWELPLRETHCSACGRTLPNRIGRMPGSLTWHRRLGGAFLFLLLELIKCSIGMTPHLVRCRLRERFGFVAGASGDLARGQTDPRP